MTTQESRVYELSFELSLGIVNLRSTRVDPAALRLLSEEKAREHGVLPLGFDEHGFLRVAVGVKDKDSYAGLFIELSTLVERPVICVLAMGGNVDEELIVNAYFDLDPTA